MTDMHNVFAGGLMPEHVIKGRNTRDGRRCDLSCGAKPAQGLLGQVTVMVLHCLKQRDDRIGRPPEALDGFVNVLEVNSHG